MTYGIAFTLLWVAWIAGEVFLLARARAELHRLQSPFSAKLDDVEPKPVSLVHLVTNDETLVDALRETRRLNEQELERVWEKAGPTLH